MTDVLNDIASTDVVNAGRAALAVMQRALADGAPVVAQNTSGVTIAGGSVVKLVSRATVDSFAVPTMAKAVAADFGDAIGIAVEDELGSTSILNNAVGLVSTGGPVKINTGIAANALVWIDPSTAGALTATPQAGQPAIGKILVTGASGILLLAPRGIRRAGQNLQSFFSRFVFAFATNNRIFFRSPYANFKVSQVYLVSETATTGSGAGNRYDFQVRNFTAGNNLLSAVKTTNGAEIGATVPYSLGVNQNQTLASGDVLRLETTKTGSPTDLSAVDTGIILEGEPV